jgi:hypothetical protein
MRRTSLGALMLCALLAGCGAGSKEPTTGTAHREDLAAQEQRVAGCVRAHPDLEAVRSSIAARTRFIDCFAPTGKAALVESCAARALNATGSTATAALEQQLAVCVERYQ